MPTLSTDVGSCRQLIYGLDDEDQALGASGAVVGIADAQALAEASLHFLSNPEAWHKAAQAGILRVERYYTHPIMFARYRAVYEQALKGPTISIGYTTPSADEGSLDIAPKAPAQDATDGTPNSAPHTPLDRAMQCPISRPTNRAELEFAESLGSPDTQIPAQSVDVRI